jgi:hypothetical protein
MRACSELLCFPTLKVGCCEELFQYGSAELQIPPLRYASVGMTKGRAALSFGFDPVDARKVVLIADHSKFGTDGMVHVAPLTDVDQIVSDMALDPQFKRMLKENGIEVLLA